MPILSILLCKSRATIAGAPLFASLLSCEVYYSVPPFRILERAGLPRSVRLHDLRHACATILLKAGQPPKFVQELLATRRSPKHYTLKVTYSPVWATGWRTRWTTP